MTKTAGAAHEHSISGFFVFCLIGVFAVLATILTLFGVRAYRNVYDAAAMNSESQISVSYLQNKVHSGDRAGDVLLEDAEGTVVLKLREHIGGMDYETRIYFYNGNLSEYFCQADETFDPELGSALAPLASFSIQPVSPRLLKVMMSRSGEETSSSYIALRSGEVQLR